MKLSLRRRGPNAAASDHRGRRGFALVEIIVAMLLLAIAVSSLAAMMYSISTSGKRVTGDAYRNGVLMAEVNRLIALPYDSLAVGVSSFSTANAPFPHSRVVTVTEPAARVKTVRVVVTPVNPNHKSDSVKFTRTNARTSKVLCTICSDKN